MDILNQLLKKRLSGQKFDHQEKYWEQLQQRLDKEQNKKLLFARIWVLMLMLGFAAAGLTFHNYNSSSQAIANKPKQETEKANKQVVTETAKNFQPLSYPVAAAESKNKTLYTTETSKMQSDVSATSARRSLTDEEGINAPSLVERGVAEVEKNETVPLVAENTSHEINYNPSAALMQIKGLSKMSNEDYTISLIPYQQLPDYAKNNRFQILTQVYGGASLSFQKLSGTGNLANSIVSRKGKEEKPAIVPQLGMDIVFKKGPWQASIGLNFHQQGVQTRYTDSFYKDVLYDSTNIVAHDISGWQLDTTFLFAYQYETVIQPGDTIVTYYNSADGLFFTSVLPQNTIQTTIADTNYYAIIDSNWVNNTAYKAENIQKTKRIKATGANNKLLQQKSLLSYVEVPVTMGYQFDINKWGFGINAGVGFGFLTGVAYASIDDTETGIYAPASTYFKKTMLNGILRLGVQYQLNKSMSICLNPMARINMNSVKASNELYSQKFTGIGIQGGVQYIIK